MGALLCHCRGDAIELLAEQIWHRERALEGGADLRHALPADLGELAVSVLGCTVDRHRVTKELAQRCMFVASQDAVRSARQHDHDLLSAMSLRRLRQCGEGGPAFLRRARKAEILRHLVDQWHPPPRLEEFEDDIGAIVNRLDSQWQHFTRFSRQERIVCTATSGS